MAVGTGFEITASWNGNDNLMRNDVLLEIFVGTQTAANAAAQTQYNTLVAEGKTNVTVLTKPCTFVNAANQNA